MIKLDPAAKAQPVALPPAAPALNNDDVNNMILGTFALWANSQGPNAALELSSGVSEILTRRDTPFTFPNGFGSATTAGFLNRIAALSPADQTAAYDAIRCTHQYLGQIENRNRIQEAMFQATERYLSQYYSGALPRLP